MPASPAPFCQIAIGDIQVTYVPDGSIYSEPLGSFPGSTPEMWETNPHLLDDGLVVMSLGVLLVRSGGMQVLVDLGWGPTTREFARPDGTGRPGGISGGQMIDNLAALGVQPGDIDAVLFSHLHSDHTGWIIDPATATGDPDAPGTALFPTATHYLSQAEWDYWSHLAPGTAGPQPTPEQLAVLGTTRISLLDGGATPVPGVNVMPTPGHTPGHLSFVISSGTDRAVVLGDAVHCPIEISEPELSFSADVDAKLAQRTRRFIEQELLRDGTIAAAPHFADLVFGRLMPGEGKPTWHFPNSQLLDVAS